MFIIKKYIHRFDVAGIHPTRKLPGTLTQVSYDKKSMSPLVRNRVKKNIHVNISDYLFIRTDLGSLYYLCISSGFLKWLKLFC